MTPALAGYRRVERRTRRRWAADLLGAGELEFRPRWRRSRVRFLGCKVSHADAHAVRERLLADGHSERAGGADVAVVNTCCVTHEARPEVAPGRVPRGARRTPACYVTGCARQPGRAIPSPACRRTSIVVASPQRGHARVSSPGTSARSAASRPTAARPRARVRQDPGRLQLLLQLLRRSRSCAARRAAAAPSAVLRRDPAPSGAGPREVVLTGINLGCFRDRAGRLHARAADPRGGRDRRACAGCVSRRSRSTTSTAELRRGAARDADGRSRHLHVPLQSGDDGVLRAMARPLHGSRPTSPLEPLGGLQPHHRRDRRLSGRGRARVRAHARRRTRGRHHEGARLPVLAAARDCDGRRRTRCRRP